MSDTKRVKEIDVLSLLKKVASRKKEMIIFVSVFFIIGVIVALEQQKSWLLYTSDAADERSSVDLGGRPRSTKRIQKHQLANDVTP